MPASFPTSAKTFTSRNSGDVIQPAHINDLQDEVNAIETGLLNKTAQLALNSTLTIGVVPYVFPSSGGVVGSVLTTSSTSGSTMVLAWQVPSGVLDRVTTQQDVVNTIVETAVYTYAVPSNTLSSNRALRVTMTGSYLDNAGGTHNLVTQIKYGGSVVAAFTNASPGNVATRAPIRLESLINANGSSTSQRAVTTYDYGTGANDSSNGAVTRQAAMHSTLALDASTTQTLTITITHSFADPTISLRRYLAMTELL